MAQTNERIQNPSIRSGAMHRGPGGSPRESMRTARARFGHVDLSSPIPSMNAVESQQCDSTRHEDRETRLPGREQPKTRALRRAERSREDPRETSEQHANRTLRQSNLTQ